MTTRAAIYRVPELSTVPPRLVLPLLYSTWGPGRKWNLTQNLSGGTLYKGTGKAKGINEEWWQGVIVPPRAKRVRSRCCVTRAAVMEEHGEARPGA